MSDDALVARARRSVEEKSQRGVYAGDLRDALAEPLDLRSDPAVAAGPAWPEAVATVTVTVSAPPPSSRRGVGPAVTALKRTVERALRWYLPPVAAQITRHNQAVLDVLAEHNRQIVELRREVDGLRRRLTVLEERTRADGDHRRR
ncbi:MAG TPA: hypothetical protein VN193_12625 [Candidatus Angelobacter sp.]|jgi:hypothetical protein|nr:hypothetical protein [Candidatus Angelobacter sp.]